MEGVLEDYERTRRLSAVAIAMGAADDDTLAQWRAESADWAGADSDLDSAPQ
jgi:hypothetical protein